jgi:RNA polymerase-binding transcription factor DksA
VTSIDTAEFQKLLEAERDRLAHSLAFLERESPGALEDELGEIGGKGVDNHLGDMATATFDRELDDGLGDGARQTLGQIEAALRRIDDGTYGTCQMCGQAIGEERLRALPWAALCIDDQRRSG